MTSGYRIKTVSKLTGVARNTLLAWERRYGFVVPRRTDNGYRVYSDADVARLRQIKRLVDEGHAVSEAIAILDTLHRRSGSMVPGFATLHQDHHDRLLAALLSFDRPVADAVVTELGTETFESLLRIYYPLLEAIGEGWANGTYTIAQEHFAAGWVRGQLDRMLAKLDHGPESGPVVSLACFPGETHELGVLGLGVRFALAGWRVVYLGANMPEEPLIDFLQSHPPRLVCVSVVMPAEAAEVVPYVTRLRRSLPSSVAIAMGGGGLPWPLPKMEGVHFGSSFTSLLQSL